MTGASKILTVSYGTFSCTLEGFDDPFSTMRSIAEYFRDLAADDRYFGAEPPTPDTAMLQRIAAQSQIGPKAGRIEAQLNDDGVVLRQTDSVAAPAPSIAAVSAAPAPAPAPAVAAAVAPAPGTVADKLSRIRAVVARSGGDLGGFVEDDSNFVTDAAANAVSAPNVAPLRLDTQIAPESVNTGYQDEDEEVPSVLDVPADVAPTATDDEITASESVQTGQADSDSVKPDVAQEDAIEASEATDIVEPIAEETEIVAGDTAVAVAEIADEAPAIAAAPDAEPEVAKTEDDLAARIAALRDASAQKDAEAANSERAEIAARKDAAAEAYDDEDEADPVEVADSSLTEDNADGDDSSVEEVISDLEDEEFDTFAKAPVARGDVAVDRILEKTNTEMNEHEGSRRRSAIAHLKAAVAATRADGGRAPGADDDDDAMSQFRDDLAKAVRPQRPSSDRSGRRDERPTMANASAPLMLVPSLRVDGEDGAGAQIAPAVRPRRVANSDVVVEDEAEETGVSTAETFAEFVVEQEARELPELMEAAAAYATHIEGRPHVTRPLVMSRVLAQRDGLKREDALRTFGRLLRDGRIIRLKRGKFAVAEDTRFRAAGNQ